MIPYREMYCKMVRASERAMEEIEKQNYEAAKAALIAAEQACEELYISAPQRQKQSNT